MSKALVIGGSNGIGLSIVNCLEEYETIVIMDKVAPEGVLPPHVVYVPFDLLSSDYSSFDSYQDFDTLIITAGFGSLALFKDVSEQYIIDSFGVNTVGVIRVIKHFYNRMLDQRPFYCVIMVSIAGFMSSPFYAVYGATKAALKIFIESVNVELEKSGTRNQILNVSPGFIKGTKFNSGENNLSLTATLAKEIILCMKRRDDLLIPNYKQIFKEVLERYHSDFREEGRHSYDYKLNRLRLIKEELN